ncbi:MAG: hypothetical protein ACKODS_09935, partial [Methylophilaceae bacterium]
MDVPNSLVTTNTSLVNSLVHEALAHAFRGSIAALVLFGILTLTHTSTSSALAQGLALEPEVRLRSIPI